MQIVPNNCNNEKFLISGERNLNPNLRYFENHLLYTFYCYFYYSYKLFFFHIIVLAGNEFNISLYCTGGKGHRIKNVRKHTKCKYNKHFMLLQRVNIVKMNDIHLFMVPHGPIYEYFYFLPVTFSH